mgnify:CR=1 FL=1
MFLPLQSSWQYWRQTCRKLTSVSPSPSHSPSRSPSPSNSVSPSSSTSSSFSASTSTSPSVYLHPFRPLRHSQFQHPHRPSPRNRHQRHLRPLLLSPGHRHSRHLFSVPFCITFSIPNAPQFHCTVRLQQRFSVPNRCMDDQLWIHRVQFVIL